MPLARGSQRRESSALGTQCVLIIGHTCHALRYLCLCTFTRTLSCQLCLAMQAMHASNGLVCPLPRAQHVAILAGRSCAPRPNSTATCWEHVCAGSIFTGANFVVSKENSPSTLSNSIMVFFCWEAKKKIFRPPSVLGGVLLGAFCSQ